MSTSAAQSAAFFAEAVQQGSVYTVRDTGGFPAPPSGSGERAQSFWSKRTRAERIIQTVSAYASFAVVEIPLDAFVNRWLPGLERDGFRVGVNWSGDRATGYDRTGSEVALRLGQSAHSPQEIKEQP
jgi:hypothetical protein